MYTMTSTTVSWFFLLSPVSRACILRHAPDAPIIILAQTDLTAAIDSFRLLLARICLLIGTAAIAYGGYLIAKGHTLEGVLAVIGGFLIAIAVPLITYLAQLGGIQF